MNNSTEDSHVKLWRAVLGQAMHDHVDNNDNYIDVMNPDFLLVCDYAGQNPYKIKEQVIKMKAGIIAR